MKMLIPLFPYSALYLHTSHNKKDAYVVLGSTDHLSHLMVVQQGRGLTCHSWSLVTTHTVHQLADHAVVRLVEGMDGDT